MRLISFEFLGFISFVGLWTDISVRKQCTVHKVKRLTNESNGCVKAGSDICSQRILHSESQVLKLPLVEVRTGGGHIEHSCDACCCQHLSAGGVEGTAQKQEGQQLYWTTLQLKKGKVRTAKLKCTMICRSVIHCFLSKRG